MQEKEIPLRYYTSMRTRQYQRLYKHEKYEIKKEKSKLRECAEIAMHHIQGISIIKYLSLSFFFILFNHL